MALVSQDMKVVARMPTVLQHVVLEKICCTASRILRSTLAFMETVLKEEQ